MVLSAAEVKHQIRRFVGELSRHVRVERAVLFGSYAYGNPHEGSDIDLAIVSPDFGKMGRLERLEFLEEVAWNAQTHKIEAVGFTEEELQEAGNANVLSEIRDRGVVVSVTEKPFEPQAVQEERPAYALEDKNAARRPKPSLYGWDDGKLYFFDESGKEQCVSDHSELLNRLVEICDDYFRQNAPRHKSR